MIFFAFFDPSPLTLWINCSFSYFYWLYYWQICVICYCVITEYISAVFPFSILQLSDITHARTHTHTFNGRFPGLPRWAATRKVKPISEWQWHQLGHMQVCTSIQTDNHASTPPLSFLQAGCPSCRPINSIKALKAKRLTYNTVEN